MGILEQIYYMVKGGSIGTLEQIYYNGTIITMADEKKDRERSIEAILVKDGLIVSIGSFADIKARASAQAELIDLKGNTLLPGFIDAHSHMSGVAAAINQVDINEVSSLDEIRKRIRDFVDSRNYPTDKLVVARGYDHNVLKEQRHPDKRDLDIAGIENPIIAVHRSGHMGTFNTHALQMAGITDDIKTVQGGYVGRYLDNGEISGYFEENSFIDSMQKIVRDDEDAVKNLLKAQESYFQYGITTAHDGGIGEAQIKNYLQLANSHKLEIDVFAYISPPEIWDKVHEKYAAYWQKKIDHFCLNGYKLFFDGSPQAKTAWMQEPYKGDEQTGYRGIPIYTDEEAYGLVKKAVSERVQVIAHCNGDAASEQFISAYEKAVKETGIKEDLRPVMIHAQTVTYEQLDRMSRLRMIASFFIGHTYFWGDVHIKNFGMEKGKQISPVGEAIRRGVIYNFHQDSPVTPQNMLHSVWSAVNRISKKGCIIGEENRISVYEALKGVTCSAAYEYSIEDKAGSIEDGKVADFVILSENPLEVNKVSIKDIKIVQTVKAGKIHNIADSLKR